MSTREDFSGRANPSKQKLRPTPKPYLQATQLGGIEEEEGSGQMTQAQILKQIIVQKNQEIAQLKLQLQRLKKNITVEKGSTERVTITKPQATDQHVKSRQKDVNVYDYAKLRHKRILSIGQYNNLGNQLVFNNGKGVPGKRTVYQ